MATDHPTLRDVFAQLDAWRHLPSYRLEPRVDPFFAVFLPQVLAEHLRRGLDEFLLPELPLRRGTLYGEEVASRNKSKKVDFVMRSADHQTIYLVELKTDQASRRKKQDDYLSRAVDVGWQAVVEGIVTVAQHTATKYLRKYMHLIRLLEAMGYLEVPGEPNDPTFPISQRDVGAQLTNLRVRMPETKPAIRVVYVQPEEEEGEDCIGFEEFAAGIEHSGELGALFASQLRSWITKAGASAPPR